MYGIHKITSRHWRWWLRILGALLQRGRHRDDKDGVIITNNDNCCGRNLKTSNLNELRWQLETLRAEIAT